MNATTNKSPSKGITQPAGAKASATVGDSKDEDDSNEGAANTATPLVDVERGKEIGGRLALGDKTFANLLQDIAADTARYLGPDPSWDVVNAAAEAFAKGYVEMRGLDKAGVPIANTATALKRWGKVLDAIEASGWEFKRPAKPTQAAASKSVERVKNAKGADEVLQKKAIVLPPTKGDDADPVALRKAADEVKKAMRGTKTEPVAKGVASELQTRATMLENAARRAIEAKQRKERQVLTQEIIDACKVIPIPDVRKLAKQAQEMLEAHEALQEQEKPDDDDATDDDAETTTNDATGTGG